ncbi:MAG: hypothetical protein ACOZF2_06475 [Thermodesulfobacteriota bacterium]
MSAKLKIKTGGKAMLIQWLFTDGSWDARLAGLDVADNFFPWE